MRTVKHLFAMGLMLLLTGVVCAQDSVTVSDAIEMRVKSESLMKREFKELLDNISTNESSQNTKDVITGSHSGTVNKIFLNSKVVVEDDINPSFKSTATSREVTIDQYLGDFDLFYKKTESPSVFLNDFRTSNVKKLTDLYVRVYFKSLFKSMNRYSDTAYTENNRVAEIRFLKVNKRWTPYIVSISFFKPSDTANDVSNDVLLIREKGQVASASLSDSAAVKVQKNFDEELKAKKEQEEIEAFQKSEANFKKLIKDGDAALEQSDFVSALKFYAQAHDLKPYDLVPLARLDQVKRKQEAATVKKSDLYEQYISEAKGLVRKRHYKEALEAYQQALEQKPENAAKIESDVSALTKKYRILSTLDDKYNAAQYKDVIRECKDAIKQNKDAKLPEKENSDYYLFMARCYDKMVDPKEALKDYNRSYDADNDNLEAIEERAILYKKQKDYVNASADYKSYILLAKDNIKIYEEQADLRTLINGNTDEALKILDEGIRSNPKAAALYLKKGLLLINKNNLLEADKNLTSAIMIDSSNGFVFFNRGKCQYGLKHFSSAAADFESARNAGLEAMYTSKIDSLAEILNQKSADKFNQKATDSAVYYVNFAIAINPGSAIYRFNRGEYFFSVNKLTEAIVNYDDALKQRSNYTDCYFKRGLSYFKLKDYPPAIRDFRSADSLNHALYLPSRYLGDSYYATGDFAGASIYYENALRIIDAKSGTATPEMEADIYNLLGETYFKTGGYEKALTKFKSALKKNNTLAVAYYNRGLTYHKLNDLGNATEDMARAVSLQSNDYEWFYALASAYQDKKEYQKAAENYDYCIKLDTAHKRIDAIYNKGFCYYQLQNWNEALKNYERFRQTGHDTAIKAFEIQLGNIFLNTSKKDSAYKCFYRVYERDTADGVAMYNIGRTLYADGKTDEALIWFDKSFQTKMIAKSDVKKELFWDDKKFKGLRSKYF